jgi:antitoxin HicB
MSDTYELIDAATEYAKSYEDDDRECIQTDVMNAFYQGSAWRQKQDAWPEDMTAPRRTAYPASFTQGEGGAWIVQFRDVPEALTQGETLDDAIAMAADALGTALDFYFEDNRLPALPSAVQVGECLIPLPLESDLLLTQRTLAALRKAASPISLWWAMFAAQEELAGAPIPDEATILHFMGSGASTMVLARDWRNFEDALGAAAGLQLSDAERAEIERMRAHFADDEEPS